ncbi:MAG: putative quinol monooxygenase [Pyrinomonadaceae bacterium]
MPNNSVRVVASIKALPDKASDVRAVLTTLIEPTRKEAGCILYELWQNRADATDFTFVEEWESDAALDAHAASPHLKDAAARLHGLILQAPDVRRYSLVL